MLDATLLVRLKHPTPGAMRFDDSLLSAPGVPRAPRALVTIALRLLVTGDPRHDMGSPLDWRVTDRTDILAGRRWVVAGAAAELKLA